MVSICFFLSEAAHSGEKCVESLLISTSSHQGAGNVYNYNDFMKNNWMKSSSAAIGTQFWQQRWWQWCFWWYHSLLAGRQYIIELLLKGLHRLEYRGYDRFLSHEWWRCGGYDSDNQWWWWWGEGYLMTCKQCKLKCLTQICKEFSTIKSA